MPSSEMMTMTNAGTKTLNAALVAKRSRPSVEDVATVVEIVALEAIGVRLAERARLDVADLPAERAEAARELRALLVDAETHLIDAAGVVLDDDLELLRVERILAEIGRRLEGAAHSEELERRLVGDHLLVLDLAVRELRG